jgi:hypothetical protein
LLDPRFQREDWRGLTSFIESNKSAASITIFVADSNMEAYRYYAPSAKIAGPSGINTQYNEIWLMRYVKDIFDPEETVKAKIESLGYKKEGEYDFNGVGVWKYESRN